MAEEDEVNAATPIPVKSGEVIEWRDDSSALENLEENVKKYLTYAGNRHTARNHLKIANHILAEFKALSEIVNKDEVDYIVKESDLIDYVKKTHVKSKGMFGEASFLYALLEKTREELEKEKLIRNQIMTREKKELEYLKRTVREQDKTIADMEETIAGHEKKLSELEGEEIETAKQKQHELSQSLQRKNEEIAALTEKLRKTEEAKDEFKSSLGDASGLRDQIRVLNEEIQTLKTDNTNLTKENEGVRKINAKLVEENNQTLEDIKAEKDKVKKWQEAFNKLYSVFNKLLKILRIEPIQSRKARGAVEEAEVRVKEAEVKYPPTVNKGPGLF